MRNHPPGFTLAPYLFAMGLCWTVASSALAQRSAEVDMVLPPVSTQPPTYQAVEDIKCRVAFSSSSDPVFGVSEIKGTSNPVEFLVSAQLTPFRVFRIDENCSILSSWSTSTSATSMLGCAYDTATTTTYWLVQNSIPKSIVEFELGTGSPTGRSFPIGNVGVPAPLCTNDNTAVANDMAYENIASDIIQLVDPVAGQFACTFANPDDTGGGAFGNGIDDSVDASIADFVVSSGAISDTQVVRAGEYDCTSSNPDTWNFINSVVPIGGTFPQSFAEFTASGGETCMMLAEGALNEVFVLRPSRGISDCQGVDSADEKIATVNFSSGSRGFSLLLGVASPLVFRMERPDAGGSGEYVAYWNAGPPNDSSITVLPADLGPICHPMLSTRPPTEMAIFNNAGKEPRIGASTYFGAAIADPPLAPTVVRQNAAGDPSNMPAGSCWTMQGIIYNPAASSFKEASVTNAVLVFVQ